MCTLLSLLSYTYYMLACRCSRRWGRRLVRDGQHTNGFIHAKRLCCIGREILINYVGLSFIYISLSSPSKGTKRRKRAKIHRISSAVGLSKKNMVQWMRSYVYDSNRNDWNYSKWYFGGPFRLQKNGGRHDDHYVCIKMPHHHASSGIKIVGKFR